MSVRSFDIGGGMAKWFDTQGRNLITDAVKARAPVGVTGDFKTKMYAIRKTAAKGSMIIEVHSGADFPKPIWILKGTKGTQTGNPAAKLPPIDAITPWAELKGLDPWALAVSIQRKGTKANPFTLPAIASIRSTVRQSLQVSLMAYLKAR